MLQQLIVLKTSTNKINFNKVLLKINKSIHKIKLAITTQCNFACRYCFVKKTNEQMYFDTAKKAVDLLLFTKGEDKLLSIYGGEPFLYFHFIEKICSYGISMAKYLKKRLTISVCTNFSLAREKHILFLKKYNIKLIISMVGKKQYHDKERISIDGKGTYDSIRNKLGTLFNIVSKENIGISLCIFPSTVGKLQENLEHLISLGFTYFNFEIIRYYQPWTLNKIKEFIIQFENIIKYIFSSISQNCYIYLNPINWEIKYKLLSQSFGLSCPFNYNLEIYPKGEMAFSPFLLNSFQKYRYIIGNINNSFLDYKDCQFNFKNDRCRSCESDYFKTYASDEGASKVYNLYRFFCLKAAKEIEKRVLKIKAFRDYIHTIQKICF